MGAHGPSFPCELLLTDMRIPAITLYVATGNPGKLRDFAQAAEHVAGVPVWAPVTFETLPGLQTIVAPAEDRDTFEGNARLKAEYYSQHAPGLLVLSDDSGLEVDALDGRPGVRSARFAADLGFTQAGESADAGNNEALLLEMLEQTQRTARYRCVLALARDGVVLHTASGSLAGEILTEATGRGGFGYDPLFFVPSEGCTMAELPQADRLRLSHRGRAIRALLVQLTDQL